MSPDGCRQSRHVMKRTLAGMPVFAVMIAILFGMLELANWIPSAVQEGELQRFGSIEEVVSHFGTIRVYVPAFLPHSVRWPPSLIVAQKRPYVAILSEYGKTDGEGTFLIISQTARGHGPIRDALPLAAVREKAAYPFKGRTALLEVGVCETDERCSRISWEEDGYTVLMAIRDAPVDIVRMAESMIPDRPTKASAPESSSQLSAHPDQGRSSRRGAAQD